MGRKYLIINGPNLNKLGNREVNVYGTKSLEEINQELKDYGLRIGVEIDFYQSNHEGHIIDCIHKSENYHGIIINPGALMSYSYSLKDAIRCIQIPVVEIHLSNIYARETFRHYSVISDVVVGSVCGFKEFGYRLALDAIHFYLGGRTHVYPMADYNGDR